MAILDTVAALRLVRAHHLEHLHFTTLSATSRPRRRRSVLQRLVNWRVLTVLNRRIGGARAGSAGHIYQLGPAGQKLATPNSRWQHSEPSLTFADHTLAIADTYVLLHNLGGIDVDRIVTEPACWKPLPPGGPSTWLKPDLAADIAIGQQIYPWRIEVDLGTERRPALRRKLDTYLHDYQTTTGTAARVLWLVPESKRADFLNRTIAVTAAPDGLHHVSLLAHPSNIADVFLQR